MHRAFPGAGGPGRWLVSLRRVAVPALLIAAGALLPADPAAARPQGNEVELPIRVDEFAGWFHDAGNVLLHVSNRGRFGRTGSDLTSPSCEWPAGSNEEYLYGAGLWVGGVVTRSGAQDTMVSAGMYQTAEFRNLEPDEGCGSPREGICRTFEGAPNGLRRFDDDGDGLVDEDPLDGADNDQDGRVDEDFAGISQQMFRTVYYDTSTFFNQFFADEVNWHTPLGLKVTQESYVWTDPQFDDFVGVEFNVTNISEAIDNVGWDITSAYIGFMVDGDVGVDDNNLNYWLDDQGAFAPRDTVISLPSGGSDTLNLTLGYIYDTLGGENAADDVTGYCGVMFLGHTTDPDAPDPESALAPKTVGIHAFRIWSGGDDDPRDDLDRYRFLRGLHDTARTIDPPTSRANDYRFLVSAGPFAKIPAGSTLTFQVAFVMGEMVEGVDPVSGLVKRMPDFTNPIQAQRVYNGFDDPVTGETIHWATSSPPPPPNITVTPGDNHVVVEWDDFPENIPDPLTKVKDFAGYQVWKAEGWRRESLIPSDDMWRLIADFDSTELSDIDTGQSGLGKYRFVDTRVQNGFWYWYAVTAYDKGVFSMSIDTTAVPPDTTYTQEDEPKFGKFTQNMLRVMPRTTPTQTLDDIYVVPNPYREAAAWDLAETNVEPTGRRIKFFNLPPRATIRIFSLSGDLVQTIEHDENRPTGGLPRGQAAWNLVSRNNQDTVSGIYLYHVEVPDGSTKVGKFVVIR